MAIRLNGSTSGFTALDAPATAGSNTLVLPTGNGTARQTMMTDGAGALSFVNDAGAIYYRLDSTLAGANVNTAQSLFGVGVTLAASTVYQFDISFTITKSAGTTSHSTSIGFGGTATLNNIQWANLLNGQAVAYNTQLTNTAVLDSANAATARAYFAGVTGANYTQVYRISGSVSINAGGTFIPQYTLSAAPGGAYSTAAGSYIRFVPIGAAGSASSQGTWS